jgi:hypothetical protein
MSDAFRSARAAALAFAIGFGLAQHARADGGPAPTDRPAPVTDTSAEHPLPPTGTLELARADFHGDAPVRIWLGLPEASADTQPRPVRMFSYTEQRGTQLQGKLDTTRKAAEIEIDPAWLTAGTYLVEITTTERGPFPIRRYKLVVR